MNADIQIGGGALMVFLESYEEARLISG